jgi:thioesterase domain-containing protein/acyl carrier protein
MSFDKDGSSLVSGRLDDIISRGGERIAPHEIDEVFLGHPKIEQAVAFGIPHPTLGQDMAVAVVPRPGTLLAEDELRSYALENLADWQLPSRIVFVKDIPKGPKGKFQRSDLHSSLGDVLGKDSEPQTPEERTLIELWQKVLNVLKVGVHDNFFSLGGSSLAAVQLALELEKTFEISVPPSAVYTAPTVREFSNFMRKPAEAEGHSLVRLSWGAHHRRIFCLPGNMGNVHKDLGALARHLHPLEVYAFQDNPDNPVEMESLAEKYVTEMVEVDAQGPYTLLGMCSGAVVVFEMAQQLKRMGKEVACLVMVEPSRVPRGRLRGSLEMLAILMRRLSSQGQRHSMTILNLNRQQREHYLRIRWRYYSIARAVRGYRPRNYDGRVNLYLTEESLIEGAEGRLKWITLADQDIEVRKIAGTHHSITGKNGVAVDETEMQGLALLVREDLEEVQTEHPQEVTRNPLCGTF